MNKVLSIIDLILKHTLLNKKMMKFTIFSGIGLTIDLLIFFLLTRSGLYIFWSNVISSFVAVTFVYLTSTKLVHGHDSYDFMKFIYFLVYYCLSISVFSILIWLIAVRIGLYPILAKLIVVPFSLLTNYFFSSQIIDR